MIYQLMSRILPVRRFVHRVVQGAPDLYLPSGGIRIHGHWRWVGRYPDGSIRFVDESENLVVDEALDDLLDAFWRNQTQPTAWYLGCTTGSPTPAAGDTMSSHAGWTEQQNYDETPRQTWSPGAASSKSISNGTPITLTSSTSGPHTFGGGFLTSNSTKGGTTGVLSNVDVFSGGNKALATSETIDVTVTISASSS